MKETLAAARARARKAVAQFRYLPATLALVLSAARSWTFAWFALLAVQGLLPAATVYLTKLLVDSLVQAVAGEANWANVRIPLFWVALLAGVTLAAEVVRSFASWIRSVQAELVQDHITALIHDKSSAVDLAFYEDADYYDHLHRAREDARYRPTALLENLGALFQNGITLAAMTAVLIPFGVWLPAALVTSTVPALFVVLRYSALRHGWRRKASADERRTWYYDWLLTSAEAASELRLFGLGKHFQKAYQALRRRLRDEILELQKREALAQLGAGTFALLVTGAVMAWMVWQALQGRITLGSLALFYQAFNRGQQMMRTLLENAGQIYQNVLFLGNLFEFLALESRMADPPLPERAPVALERGIRFENLTFFYPRSATPALLDFHLTIPAGRLVAFVGRNGAGKSTLVKLLCRLYDPNAGRILIDGVDLRAFAVRDVRRLITVLFQEPVRYQTTARENIGVGDIEAAPHAAAIEAATRASGADVPIGRLPQGYETMLGKWFGGMELSAGEWQRVALARAYLRQAAIVVLDEPTSAMDAWTEADWMSRFRRLVAGRTAMIITHRFTTAMQADAIHVMEGGRIVESGSHEELLARNGFYAEGWRAQIPDSGERCERRSASPFSGSVPAAGVGSGQNRLDENS